MRHDVVNEVEERRVIRLLAGLADEVPGLGNDEVDTVLAAAAAPTVRPRRARRFGSSARYLPAVAAMAVIAIGVSAQLDRSASRPSSALNSGSAPIATFPEATALQLLISSEPR